MVHKLIFYGCSLATLCSAFFGIASIWCTFYWELIAGSQFVGVNIERSQASLYVVSGFDTDFIEMEVSIARKLIKAVAAGSAFKYGRYDRPVHTAPGTRRLIRFKFPLWVPFIVFGIFPVLSMIRASLRRQRRRKRNECLDCGYNLTGLPEPRCPECGANLVPKSVASFGHVDEKDSIVDNRRQ